MLGPSGHRPSGREHERARFNVKRCMGANPRTGFWQVSPVAYGWTNQKYEDEKLVERGDPLTSRLAPPGSKEADHSAATGRVRPSRRGYAVSVERTTKGETTASDTASARPSGRADERPQCRAHANRAVRRASAHIVCKTPSGAN